MKINFRILCLLSLILAAILSYTNRQPGNRKMKLHPDGPR